MRAEAENESSINRDVTQRAHLSKFAEACMLQLSRHSVGLLRTKCCIKYIADTILCPALHQWP